MCLLMMMMMSCEKFTTLLTVPSSWPFFFAPWNFLLALMRKFSQLFSSVYLTFIGAKLMTYVGH